MASEGGMPAAAAGGGTKSEEYEGTAGITPALMPAEKDSPNLELWRTLAHRRIASHARHSRFAADDRERAAPDRHPPLAVSPGRRQEREGGEGKGRGGRERGRRTHVAESVCFHQLPAPIRPPAPVRVPAPPPRCSRRYRGRLQLHQCGDLQSPAPNIHRCRGFIRRTSDR
jgi:hypothetical protein